MRTTKGKMNEQKENAALMCPVCHCTPGIMPLRREVYCIKIGCMMEGKCFWIEDWNCPRRAATAIKIEALEEAINMIRHAAGGKSKFYMMYTNPIEQAIKQLKKG